MGDEIPVTGEMLADILSEYYNKKLIITEVELNGDSEVLKIMNNLIITTEDVTPKEDID